MANFPRKLFNLPGCDRRKRRCLNAKLRELGWTAKQFDAYLDYMHQEKDINSLVTDYLFYAPLNAIRQEADALGIFEEDEE